MTKDPAEFYENWFDGSTWNDDPKRKKVRKGDLPKL